MLFNLARARLAQYTPAGAQAIMRTHPQHWSRAYFRLGTNCDSVDNNLCESFNKWIVEARFYPIITMLETIRRKVMVRIQEQRAKSERWMGRICPNILKKLNAYIKLSGYCYSVDSFKLTYNYCLEPVEGQDSWPTSDRPKLKAPGYIKMPGRPKIERRREPHEQPKAKKKCQEWGLLLDVRSVKVLGTIGHLVRRGVPQLLHLVASLQQCHLLLLHLHHLHFL